MVVDQFTCVNQTPALADFLHFREIVGWGDMDKETAGRSLENTIFFSLFL